MDTSIDYMKMIEKSGISKLYNVGDYIFQKSPNDNILWDAYTEIIHDTDNEYELALIADPSWFEYDLSTFSTLLRQDQLQDMIGDGLKPLRELVANLTWVDPFDSDEYGFMNLSSMEQLWLAYVMHERYNKRWDGSDWVVE